VRRPLFLFCVKSNGPNIQITALILNSAWQNGSSRRQRIKGGNWAMGLLFVKVEAGEHHAVRKLITIK